MNTKLPKHLIDILYAWMDGRHSEANEIIQQTDNSKLILKLATAGDAYAQYLYAMLCFLHDGDENTQCGLDYLYKSCDNATEFEPPMVMAISTFLYDKDDDDKDFMTQDILLMLESSAFAASHVLLAVICMRGWGGVQVNQQRAVYELEKAFKLNGGVTSATEQSIINNLLDDVQPIGRVLRYYSDGDGGTKNPTKVIELCQEWLQRSDCNITVANAQLALAYYNTGRYSKALECCLHPDNSEHALFYDIITTMYRNDKIALDNSVAEVYARKAVDLMSVDDEDDREAAAEGIDNLNEVIARGKEEAETGVVHTVAVESQEVLSKTVEPTTVKVDDCPEIVLIPAPPDGNAAKCDTARTGKVARADKKFNKAQISAIVVATLLAIVNMFTQFIQLPYFIRQHLPYTLHQIDIISIILLVIIGSIIGITSYCEYRNHGKSYQFMILLFAVGIPLVVMSAIGQAIVAIILHTGFAGGGSSIRVLISFSVALVSCALHYLACYLLCKRWSQKTAVIVSYFSVVLIAAAVMIAMLVFAFYILKIVFSMFGSGDSSPSSNKVSDGRKTYDGGYYVKGDNLCNSSGKVIGKKYYSYEEKFYDSSGQDRKLVGEIDSYGSLKLHKK